MGTAKLSDLEIYQLSMQLGDSVWEIVLKWDYFAKDVIGKQWGRAIDSVAANISEGYGRFSFLEMRQFVRIARGSLVEHITWLKKATTRKLVAETEYDNLDKETTLSIKINNYLTYIQKQIDKK